MSRVRVLVGTRKGAFILTSDGKREEVGRQRPALRRLGDLPPQGLAGRSEPHLRLAIERLVRPDHPALRRRRQNLAPARHAAGEPTTPDGCPRARATSSSTTRPRNRQAAHTHQWYDGTQHPWEFKRVWHLEPSLTDPDTVYAGVEDAALFRSTDGGQNWHELAGLRGHGTGLEMAARRRRHGPAHDHSRSRAIPNRILHRHLGRRRVPHRRRRQDLEADQPRPADRNTSPTRTPRSATASTASPCTRRGPMSLFMQKHWDVMRSDNAGDNWHEVSGNLPTDFGFPIDVHAHEPETIYVVPIKSDSEHYPPEGKLRVYRSRTGGNEWEPLTNGLPQSNCYVNVLRDAMAVDSLDTCGIYFGTTGGQVYASPDGGDNWAPIVRDLPAVLSVEVQTLP